MRGQEEFLDFVRTALVPGLGGAERIRRGALRQLRICGLFALLFVLSIPLVVFSLPGFYGSAWLAPLWDGLGRLGIAGQERTTQAFAVLMIGSVLLMLAFGILGKYRAWRFSQALDAAGATRKIVQFLSPGARFEKSGFIPLETARESRLFPEHWNLEHVDLYTGDDRFSGEVGQARYELSEIEIHSSRRVRDSSASIASKSSRNERKITRDTHGLFLAAELDKPAGARTFILPNLAERFLGALGRVFDPGSTTLFGEQYRRVSMDNAEFEHNFRVFSEDEAQARAQVTGRFMAILLEILAKAVAVKGRTRRIINGKTVYASHITSYPGDMRVCLTGDRLYLYIETGPLFLPHIRNSVLQPETFQVFYDDLSLALFLIEELDRHARFGG